MVEDRKGLFETPEGMAMIYEIVVWLFFSISSGVLSTVLF